MAVKITPKVAKDKAAPAYFFRFSRLVENPLSNKIKINAKFAKSRVST